MASKTEEEDHTDMEGDTAAASASGTAAIAALVRVAAAAVAELVAITAVPATVAAASVMIDRLFDDDFYRSQTQVKCSSHVRGYYKVKICPSSSCFCLRCRR